jgi:uncharacterized membrane protein
VIFANPLPPWALAAAVAGCALVGWMAYRRASLAPRQRAALSMLRGAALAWLVVCLMRPVVAAHPDRDNAIVPILVDASRSMSLPGEGGQPRIQQARALLHQILTSTMAPDLVREPLAFGDRVSPADPNTLEAHDAHTNIGGALQAVRERYRGQPIAGVILLSDGGDNGTIDLERAAEDGPPVYAVGVGPSSPLRDREVLGVTTADAVLDGASIDVTATAVAHGYGDAPFQLRLLENGRAIDLRSIRPAADGAPVSAVFTVSPKRGAAAVYTIEVPPAADELVLENNARSVAGPPPRPPLRVLLVQGAPGFEHAFLERALASDPAIQIDSVVRKGRDDRGQDTFYVQSSVGAGEALLGGIPASRAALFAYDVVVLANIDADALSETRAELLRAFVSERGGGLLVLGARGFERQGLRGTPLEAVLPLDVSDRASGVAAAANPSAATNRVTLTAAGEAHPMMQIGASPAETRKRWAAMPPLAAVSPLGGPRPGSTVLALTGGPGGVTRALVAVQRVGEGRAMVFAGEASWRWRMMLPADDHSYERFWRQSIRWLGQNAPRPVQITSPAASAPGDLSIRVTARDAAFVAQHDATVGVQLVSPDGRTVGARVRAREDGYGNYGATITAPQAGLYRVVATAHRNAQDLGTATGALLVGGVDDELTDPRLNTGTLSRIARASHGAVITPREIPAILARLRAAAPTVVRLEREDLWNRPWSFAMLAAFLSTEWLARRRWGLR